VIEPIEDHGGAGSMHAGYGAHQQIVVINAEKLAIWTALLAAVALGGISLYAAWDADREGRLAQNDAVQAQVDIAKVQADLDVLKKQGPQTIIVKQETEHHAVR
jgi:hypothetical protein